MKILVVDDGQLAINSLIRILCRVAPDCDYISAMTTEDALSWMRQGPMDAAFLNLEMPGMNGLALTRMIQKLQPRCNIIVVTEHPEYALEALQMSDAEKQKKTETLTHTVQLLESAKLHAGEEEKLLAERKLVADAERISRQTSFVYRGLRVAENGNAA